jgi:hypothetical protein
MANYYTKASFVVVLSETEKAFAFDVLKCVQDEGLDLKKKYKNKNAKQYSNDVYRIAKKFALFIEDYDQGDVNLGFQCDPEERGLWIYHDETIDTDIAATFVHLLLKHFNSDKCVSFEASHTCSKALTDGFGGHAAFVTRKGVKWFSTHQWLSRQEDKFKDKNVV